MSPITTPQPALRTPGDDPGAASPLTGREQEEALLSAALQQLRGGRPVLAEVHGPPGVGRSALLARVVALAGRAGIPVAAAQACPEESGVPYGLAAALHRALARSGHAAAPPRHERPGEPERAALCRTFLAAARTGPLLLVADDLQYADQASLRWLQALGRRLAGTSLMLLTSRCDVVPAGPDDRIDSCPLDDEDAVARHTLALDPLPDTAVGHLLTRAWDTPADLVFLGAAVRAVGGNPALLRSVTSHFVRHGWRPTASHLPHLADCAAEAVRRRTRHTLDLLPEELRAVLRVIAVAEPDCTPSMITALTGVPAPRALARLSGTGLLLPGDRPAFHHPAAAEAVLADLSVKHREELHSCTAAWAYWTAAPDSVVARVLLGARPAGADWAVGVLRSEASRRRIAGRTADATRLLRRALREPAPPAQRVRLLTELAAAVLPSDPETADRYLRQALLTPADSTAAPAWVHAAELLVARGDMAAAQPLIALAAGRAAPEGDQAGALRALYWLAEQSEPEAAHELDHPPVPPLGPQPAGAAEAAAAAWRTALRGHDIGLARRLARTALAPAAGRTVPLLLQVAACHVLVLSGDHDEACTALDAVLVHARHADVPPVAGLALLVTGLAELGRGRPDAAWDALDRAQEAMLSNCRTPFLTPGLIALEALVRLEQGEPDEAERLLARAHPYGTAAGLAGALLFYTRGRLHLARGHREQALADLLECGRRLLARQVTNPAFLPWRWVAASACGTPADGSVAAGLLAEEQHLARAWGVPGTRPGSATDGGAPPAGPGTANPADRSTPGSAPRAAAPTGRGRRARGGGPPAPRAQDRRLSPGPAPRPAPRQELTAAELRVAALAADGLPNRAIASRLSVTPRTVELHLTKTYRKLGIQGRPDLAAALGHQPKATS
ncbi:AAA family ATPase [Streptomyces sp. URMC 124]|uniref:AAA family ATPase n=1 Tax=Streptomyces sp. URMC 124 TaxID=3423405 RepID=UPI003F1A8A5B